MRGIALLIGCLLLSTTATAEPSSEKQASVSEGAKFLATREGFLFWAGAMYFQSSTCKAPLPEAMIDALAKRAGVTKEEFAQQGAGSPFAEGYFSAQQEMKNSGQDNGQDKMCARYNAGMAALRAKGVF